MRLGRRAPRRRLATALGAAALGACLLLGRGSGAAAEDAAARATLDRSVRFLQEAQNADGGFGGVRGEESDPLFTAWAAYALAAAGINPQDQAQPGGLDVFSYLAAHTAGLRETTDFDRVALDAIAAGTSPNAFGPVHPLDTILSRQLPDGSFSQPPGATRGWVNSTIWSIFPLSTVSTEAAETAVRRAADWLIAQQNPDGSWGGTAPGSAPDADMTGAAIQALVAAGVDDAEVETLGLEYLHGMQGPDGGFRETRGGPTNSASTAWVIQGLWAAGIDPRGWRTPSGADPLAFLASLQRPDGSIGWTAGSDLNSLWMTAQAGPALAGRPYPLPPVPRAVAAPRRPAPPRPTAAGRAPPGSHRGHGGTGVVHGDGVIAGGGGNGAPLYSAPQPQSGGGVPGGARLLDASPREPEAQAAAEGKGGAGGGGRREAGERSSRGGAAVEGLLVGGGGPRSPAAPGLFGADSGGRPPGALLFALLAGLAAAVAIGSRREAAGIGVG
jgi:Squalene-hopene cyclase C-terminal domain/Prenyltransferase and squalene oxidase repeat